nr:hypothetical protein BHI3_07440 [Bacteriovorax sp. HI3]
MTQILVLTEDQKVNSVIQNGLFEKYGTEVLVRNGVSEAISMLDILPAIEMIVCRDKLAPRIFDYLIKNKENFESEVKVVVLGELESKYPHVSFIPNKANFQKVIAHLGFVMGKENSPQSFEEEPQAPPPAAPTPMPAPVEAKEEIPDNGEEDNSDKTTVFRSPFLEKKPPTVRKTGDPTGSPVYIGISMKYFLALPETKMDFNLYSRVKKGEGFEYNVKIAGGTKVTRADIDRLLVRGGRELYVAQEDYKAANEILSGFFLDRFKRVSNIQERMQLNSDSYEILLDVFKNGTLDKYNVEIIKEVLKSMDFLLKSPNPLDAFLVGLKNTKLSYGYAHSYMGCMLLFAVMGKFSWSQDQTRNKILYLALFHDLALNSDRLIKAHHSPAERAKLSEDDLAVVNGHADAAAAILETIIKSSKEVPSIVREHHGMRNGRGFPESLSLGISPLTMSYIVIEDFVTRFMEKAEKEEITKEMMVAISEELKNKYVKLTYADVAEELQKFLKDR